MTVQLNHTIVWVHDHQESADFYSSILGLRNGHLLEIITTPYGGWDES